MVKQYGSSRLDEARDAPVVQVIAPAFAPDKRSSPKRMLILVGSFIVGCLLGTAWVILSFWREQLSALDERRLRELRTAAFSWSGRHAP